MVLSFFSTFFVAASNMKFVQSSSFPSYITDIDTFTPAVLHFLCYKKHDSPLKQGLKATGSRRERNNENSADTENGDPVIALSLTWWLLHEGHPPLPPVQVRLTY
jgi:hypothetical protein